MRATTLCPIAIAESHHLPCCAVCRRETINRAGQWQKHAALACSRGNAWLIVQFSRDTLESDWRPFGGVPTASSADSHYVFGADSCCIFRIRDHSWGEISSSLMTRPPAATSQSVKETLPNPFTAASGNAHAAASSPSKRDASPRKHANQPTLDNFLASLVKKDASPLKHVEPTHDSLPSSPTPVPSAPCRPHRRSLVSEVWSCAECDFIDFSPTFTTHRV